MKLEYIRNLSRLGIEVWKDIPDFEDYQASNLGNVRSKNFNRTKKTKTLLKFINNQRRYAVSLCKNGKQFSNRNISVLVAMAFLNHKSCGMKLVVDHIDNNSLNDRLYNLQAITQRQNSSKDRKGTSKYVGVSWRKTNKKWVSVIRLNKKVKHLGLFTDELKAANAYKKALKEYEEQKAIY